MTDRSYFQDQLNTEALNTATKALTKIEDLETHTEQQFKSLKESQMELKRDINRSDELIMQGVSKVERKLDKMLWTLIGIGGGLVTILLSVIAYLIINGQPWPHVDQINGYQTNSHIEGTKQ